MDKAEDCFPTSKEAPRVLISKQCPLTQRQKLHEWVDIGVRSKLHLLYRLFTKIAQDRFEGSLSRRIAVCAGMGRKGAAEAFAVKQLGGIHLGIDINEEVLGQKMALGYIDKITEDYLTAKRWLLQAKASGEALSIGLVGHAETILQLLFHDKIFIDILTDQTSAYDPLRGYIPTGKSPASARVLMKKDPLKYSAEVLHSISREAEMLLLFGNQGTFSFECYDGFIASATKGGCRAAETLPKIKLVDESTYPFLWIALSGDVADMTITEKMLLEHFPENLALHKWLELTHDLPFEGLPGNACWLTAKDCVLARDLFRMLFEKGHVQAPIAMSCCQLNGNILVTLPLSGDPLYGENSISL